jgi:hypothetical protein
MTSAVVWGLTPFGLVEIYLRFELLAWHTLRFWKWRQYVPPKRRQNFTKLYGVTAKKIVKFILSATRTSFIINTFFISVRYLERSCTADRWAPLAVSLDTVITEEHLGPSCIIYSKTLWPCSWVASPVIICSVSDVRSAIFFNKLCIIQQAIMRRDKLMCII